MVSIIVPIYNAERYINRCVKSIAGQSYQNLEIILVDDGSKDNSLQLCNEWASRDKRIHVVTQANRGVSAARNAGLAHATGQYIMFLDSDDYMKSNMCAVMLSKLEEKDADLVICGTEENGGTYWKPKHDADYTTLESFKHDFIQLLMTELLSPSWNKLYRKEKITSGFPVGVSFGEDLIFNLSYLKNCQRVSFIADALHFHEKENANSLAHIIDSRRLVDIETLQTSILNFYGKKDDALVHGKYIKDIIQYVKILMKDNAMAYKKKVSLLNEWRQKSYISCYPINDVPLNYKNKIFLFLLQKRLWRIVYFIVITKNL